MPQECVPVAAQPPRPRSQSPLSWPARGLVCRPERGLAPWRPRAPHTAPRLRRSHPGPLRGLWKDQQTARRVEISLALQAQTERAWTEGDPRRGDLSEQAAACVQGLTRHPPAAGKLGDRWRLCLMGQSREREPRRSPPWQQGEGSREAGGASAPASPSDPGGPCLCGLGPHRADGAPRPLQVAVTRGK